MGIVDRHKKPGGFRKLVNSLETTPADKRAKILEVMRAEDKDFVAEVEKCVFTFEEFENVSDLIMCEVVFAFQKEMRTIAVALHKCANEKLADKFLKNLRPNQRFELKDFSENLTSVLQREQIAARFRIIEKARELEGQGKFTLKPYSPNYRDF